VQTVFAFEESSSFGTLRFENKVAYLSCWHKIFMKSKRGVNPLKYVTAYVSLDHKLLQHNFIFVIFLFDLLQTLLNV
jgi:hypothetical protein